MHASVWGVKLLWIVAAHLRKNRDVRAYRGRPRLVIGRPSAADARFIADGLNGFARIWGD